MDETYVKIKGRRTYMDRAVESRGRTIDFLLSAKRDAEAAKGIFRAAISLLEHTRTGSGRARVASRSRRASRQ